MRQGDSPSLGDPEWPDVTSDPLLLGLVLVNLIRMR
jgi:hypothetical protein